MKKILLCFLLLHAFQSPAQVKKVLLEEFTTNLCGFCPPRSHDIQVYYENHTSSTVFMTHHAGFGTDSMTNASASTFASYFQPSTFGFAPAIMIDRAVYAGVDTVPYMTVIGFDTIATRVAGNTPEVSISITGTYNPATRALNVEASATFPQSLSAGNRNISCYLVEDSVIGAGMGWDQKCYDANWANLHYPGQYNAGTTYISQYPHRNVQRTPLTGGSWGSAGVIPAVPVINTPYSVSNSITLPANYDASRVKLVAIVANHGMDKFNRAVMNVEEMPLSNLTTTALAESATITQLSLSPNPANSTTTLRFEKLTNNEIMIRLFDLTGQLVKTIDQGTTLAKGFYQTNVDVSGLSSGLYTLQLLAGGKPVYGRIVVGE